MRRPACPKKRNRAPISGGRDFVNAICADLCSITTSCRPCLLGTVCKCSSSSSCHQTCVFHLSTHFFAISLKLLRSSNAQGRARMVHCIMCAVFSVVRPHSHVTYLCSLLHVNPLRSRFRHLHVVHGLS